MDSQQRARDDWRGAPCGRKASKPKRVLALVGSLCSLLTVARVVVLFVESWSAVASEREADSELMQMCDVGTAAQSADFRALCVRKRADRASPVLLKALLRACSTAFADFCELFSSWTKVALLVLFCLTGIAAPVVKALAALFTAHLRKSRRTRRSTGALRYGQRLQLGHVAPTATTRTRTTRARRAATTDYSRQSVGRG